MDFRIDLDEAARHIGEWRSTWTALGVDAGELTWRDQGKGWPPPISTDRARVIDADSIGVRLCASEREGRAVLYKGGWADLEYWAEEPSAGVFEAPGYEDRLDLDRFDQLLNRLTSLFRSPHSIENR